MPRPRFWLGLVALHAALALVLGLLGAPSPFLFAGVIAGLVLVRVAGSEVTFPPPLRMLGLAVLGVAAGSKVDAEVVRSVAESPGVILGGVLATLALTLAVGQVLRLSREVDSATAALASVAGGAASISLIARELGADEAMVLAVQYLRVLIVIATVPVVTALTGAHSSDGGVANADVAVLDSAILLGVSIVVGLLVARTLSFGGSALIVPLVIAAGVTVSGVVPDASVPPPALAFGFSVAGLSVGLVLTGSAMRKVARVLPFAVLQLALTLVGCAALGVVVAELLGISRFDGYLATSPGGLPFVTAIAIDNGGAVGVIVTMQVVRLAAAITLAPLLARHLRRRPRGGSPGTATPPEPPG